MKTKHERAMDLMDALDNVDESMVLNALDVDTPEQFAALGKPKGIPRWAAIAACIALLLTLVAFPVYNTVMGSVNPRPVGFPDPYDHAYPPRLLITNESVSLYPYLSGYDWHSSELFGGSFEDSFSGYNPLATELQDRIPWGTSIESTLMLIFEDSCDDDNVRVRCWPAECFGNPDAYDEAEFVAYSSEYITLKTGRYIYEVTVEWDRYYCDHIHRLDGTVTYVFGVEFGFDLSQLDTDIQIISGDDVLRAPTEGLVSSNRYDYVTGEWEDRRGSGAYVTLQNSALEDISLPAITLTRDLQIHLGDNGQLNGIRAFYREYKNNRFSVPCYLSTMNPDELSALPPDRWYILLDVTWRGRYIESEGRHEIFRWEYAFILDVPPATAPDYSWEFDETSGTLTISGHNVPDFTNKNKWTSPPWVAVTKKVRHIVINDGITGIGDYAFQNMISLETIALPDGLKEIGDYAFYRAYQLTGVHLPDSLEKIGDYALAECRLGPDFQLPNGLQSIGEGTFFGCALPESLTIPESVTFVGGTAFFNCTDLEEVIIHGNLPTMLSTFSGCYQLKVIRFCGDAPNSLANIASSEDRILCFYPIHNATWTDELLDTANLNQTVWFASEKPLSEQLPVEGATSGYCGRTAHWKLEDGVLTISGTGDVTYVGWDSYREQIRKVVICDGITSIEAASFYNCKDLTSVTIPQTVTSIGVKAFSGCEKLKAVTLPNHLEYLGIEAFYNCTSLTSIKIPGSLTRINTGAFTGCSALKKVTFSEGLAEIGNAAFYKCIALTEIHFPATLKTLGNTAFAKCTKLQKIYFYKDVPDVRLDTFAGVWATAYYPPGNLSWISGGMAYHGGNITEKPDYNQPYQGCVTHKFTDWVITEESTPLTQGMKERTCQACGYAERESTGKIVYDGALPEHPEWGEPIAEGENYMVNWALYPDGTLTVFGRRVMERSSGYAYPWLQYADQIKHLIVEEGLALIAKGAFSKLPNLETVVLPSTLMVMEEMAFWDCPKLQSIVIPAKVEEIQGFAFADCPSLKEIYFLGDAPQIAASAFGNANATAYYPADNTTWTEAVLDNYGGSIFWIAGDPGAYALHDYRKEEES